MAPCKIVKVDVDENRALALQYAVASIPTLLVFRNGQLVNRSVCLREIWEELSAAEYRHARQLLSLLEQMVLA